MLKAPVVCVEMSADLVHPGHINILRRAATAVAALREHGEPALLELSVRPGLRADLGRPTRTLEQSKREFMAAVRADRPAPTRKG